MCMQALTRWTRFLTPSQGFFFLFLFRDLSNSPRHLNLPLCPCVLRFFFRSKQVARDLRCISLLKSRKRSHSQLKINWSTTSWLPTNSASGSVFATSRTAEPFRSSKAVWRRFSPLCSQSTRLVAFGQNRFKDCRVYNSTTSHGTGSKGWRPCYELIAHVTCASGGDMWFGHEGCADEASIGPTGTALGSLAFANQKSKAAPVCQTCCLYFGWIFAVVVESWECWDHLFRVSRGAWVRRLCHCTPSSTWSTKSYMLQVQGCRGRCCCDKLWCQTAKVSCWQNDPKVQFTKFQTEWVEDIDTFFCKALT